MKKLIVASLQQTNGNFQLEKELDFQNRIVMKK